jgi:hypothetical protein
MALKFRGAPKEGRILSGLECDTWRSASYVEDEHGTR